MEKESSYNTSQAINVGPTSSDCTTRSEYFSVQEDPRKIEAIESLERIGIFLPMNELELYHGRVPNGEEGEWSVKSDFSNSGNNTGNWNVNKISALNTGDYNTAREFSIERTVRLAQNSFVSDQRTWKAKELETRRRIETGEIPLQVHRIISSDPNAVIINSDFSRREQQKIAQEILPLLPKILEGSPVGFEYRDTIPLFRNTIEEDFNLKNKGYINEEEIPLILQKIKTRILKSNNPQAFVDEQLVTHIAGAVNSRFLMRLTPVSLINKFAFSESNTFECTIETENGNVEGKLPINRDYIARFLRSNHIVGLKTKVNSATLDKDISNTILFDLKKVNTVDKVKDMEKSFKLVFGNFSEEIDKSLESSKSHPLVKLLTENYYATPQQIIEEAKKVKGFENLFNTDAGNWERFTLGEHTETVLRMFDETFADVLPAKLLPVMRLIILTHDLGKPEAVRHGKKNDQKEFNLKEGERFLNELGIEKNLQTLILGIIGEGQEFTSEIFVEKKRRSSELMEFSKNLLESFRNGNQAIKSDEKRAIYYMAFMLQNSDSGAYTDKAVTRRPGVWFRNYPSFNGTFKETTTLDNRAAFLR